MEKHIPHRPSLVKEVADWLRTEITVGRWEDYLPGQRALRSSLNVSQSTLEKAQRCLQREGILQIEHGRKTRIVRRPRRERPDAKTRIVRALLEGVPLQSREPSFIFSTAQMQRHLNAAGFEFQLHNEVNIEKRGLLRRIKALVEENPAACWLLVSVHQDIQQWFMDQDIPCLVEGHLFPRVRLPSIDIDYEAACSHAVGKFLRDGYKRFALLWPKFPTAGLLAVKTAFEVAVAADSRTDTVTRVVEHENSLRGLQGAVGRLLDSNLPFEGVLVFSANHALAAVSCLTHMGKRVPQDMAVLCLAHEEFLDYHMPTIASYRVDPNIYAARASGLVVRLATEGFLSKRARRILPEFSQGDTFALRHS